jgi:hypothetical protein
MKKFLKKNFEKFSKQIEKLSKILSSDLKEVFQQMKAYPELVFYYFTELPQQIGKKSVMLFKDVEEYFYKLEKQLSLEIEEFDKQLSLEIEEYAELLHNFLEEQFEKYSKILRDLREQLAPQSNQTTQSNKNHFKQIPNNCFDIYNNFKDYKPGVYNIRLDNHTLTDVYCLKGGWTVIQSSEQYGDPLSFDKDWAEYKAGFGTPGKDQWLGLDNIYKLTNHKNVSMKIRMVYANIVIAAYDDFSLVDQLHYRVKVGKQHASTLESHSLKNGVAFSTKDMDNDEVENNHCALKYQTGWWYTHCDMNTFKTFQMGPFHMAIRPQEKILK